MQCKMIDIIGVAFVILWGHTEARLEAFVCLGSITYSYLYFTHYFGIRYILRHCL